jgi:hypothetical protein
VTFDIRIAATSNRNLVGAKAPSARPLVPHQRGENEGSAAARASGRLVRARPAHSIKKYSEANGVRGRSRLRRGVRFGQGALTGAVTVPHE